MLEPKVIEYKQFTRKRSYGNVLVECNGFFIDCTVMRGEDDIPSVQFPMTMTAFGWRDAVWMSPEDSLEFTEKVLVQLFEQYPDSPLSVNRILKKHVH